MFWWFYAIAAVVALATALEALWENVHYFRSVDLSKSYVRELTLVEAKNTGSTPQNTYVFDTNNGYDTPRGVSLIAGVMVNQKMELRPAQIAPGVFELRLPIPVAPGLLVEFKVQHVYTNTVTPLPEKITMAETQRLLLRINKLPYLAYPTSEYLLSLNGFPTAQEVDLQLAGLEAVVNAPALPDLPPLPARVDAEALSLNYGPLLYHVPAGAVVPLGLVYDHNRPVSRVVNFHRAVWIPGSDVGVVQTEDYYELMNNGAQLKHGYSRADWIKGRYEMVKDHHALSRLEFPMDPRDPLDDVYFTDKVGKVSLWQPTTTHVVFQPRFPLFGGWKYNFTMGWNSRMENYVHRASEPDTYLARFPLVGSVRDMYYDDVIFSVYLPENAEVVSIRAPMIANNTEVDHELSYLDVGDGHVKVLLLFHNLHDVHSQSKVYIKYRYTAQSYWRKVATIAAFVFAGLASYYALGLLDLSY